MWLDRHSVVVLPFGNERPAVVLAGKDEIELIPSARAHLSFPQAPIRIEREPVRIAMTECPSLGRCEVRPRPGHASALSVLGRFRVLGRIRDNDSGSTRAARPGIAGHRLPVEREMENLSDWLARVLGRREALTFAGRQEERSTVRREGHDRAELTSLSASRIAPDDV